MSEEAGPSLFIEDQEQLDLAAMSIREGRRGLSFLVGPREIWPVATRYLAAKSGKGISEPRSIDTGEEMSRAMVSAEGKPSSEVESLAIATANIDVLRTLNWQREKLRRGAHVLLWAESVEGLSDIAERAPDAYSLRDRTIVFRPPTPDAPPQWDATEEPPDLRTARLLFELPRSPEERAEAAIELSRSLFHRGRMCEAISVAETVRTLLSPEQPWQARNNYLRAQAALCLYWAHRYSGHAIDAYRSALYGEAESLQTEDLVTHRLFFALHKEECSPLGVPFLLVEGAIRSSEVQRDPVALRYLLSMVAQAAALVGQFPRARVVYDTLKQTLSSLQGKAMCLEESASAEQQRGAFERAEADLRSARDANLRAGLSPHWVSVRQIDLLRSRGEVAEASRLARAVGDPSTLGVAHIIAGQFGDVDGMLDGMVALLRRHMAAGEDQFAFSHCHGVWRVLLLGTDPTGEGPVRSQAIERALGIIDEVASELTGEAALNPPWYAVLFTALRADLLSIMSNEHRPGAQAAIEAAREAVILARAHWRQAIPTCTMTLLRCLANDARWSEMGSPLREALEAAEETGNLRETALLRAFDLVRLLHLAAPRDDIERAHTSLRRTFTEIDGPRVEGETWLEVAPFFPPTATFPDPVEIAEHVHDLFLDMPMPGEAARSMEWLGDIHAARGESAPAETCYRLCLGTLERHGLLLRKPIVDRKLAALPRR